jgi:hypothetical protein
VTTSTTVPICFVDTETTDVGPRRLAWELAMIRREPDGTRKELQTFIEIDLTDASPFALAVGRFYDRHPLGLWLSGGVSGHPANITAKLPSTFWFRNDVRGDYSYITQADAALLWCRWTHGAHVVGAVPNFDTEVMGTAARAAGLIPGHHYHLVDIENLIVGYLAGKGTVMLPPWGSDELYAAAGIPPVPDDEKHTALGDARAVERAWDLVMGGAA